LAAEPRTQTLLMDGVPAPGFLTRFCQEQSLVAASVQTDLQGTPLAVCGSTSVLQFPGQHTIVAEAPVLREGRVAGYVRVAPEVPVDIEQQQRAVADYTRNYHELAAH